MTFKHTSMLLRPQGFQEKWKRPIKVVKAKQRPWGELFANLTIFSHHGLHLVSFIAIFVCFFSFKAKKVKKATLVATNTKLQNGKFTASKILLKHSKNVSKPPLIRVWFVKLYLGLLKAKRPTEGQKIEEFWKKL